MAKAFEGISRAFETLDHLALAGVLHRFAGLGVGNFNIERKPFGQQYLLIEKVKRRCGIEAQFFENLLDCFLSSASVLARIIAALGIEFLLLILFRIYPKWDTMST